VSARIVAQPVSLEAAGSPPKTITEYIGAVASEDTGISVAIMQSPSGWSEPGQTPDFDEYSIVLEGELQVEGRDTVLRVHSGQAVHTPAGEWVRYSTPGPEGARYVAVCLPAFSPKTVHRDA
jgi:mannose-6-phosphate isomerase-like protein (cupin superfamily)